MNKTIYVLHERKTKEHFLALEYYAKKNFIRIEYREFLIFRYFLKGIVKFDFKLIKKQFINVLFFFNLFFSSNKLVIIGIAPYDWHLIWIRKIIKGHSLFYFTSWCDWETDFHPKKSFAKLDLVRKSWQDFIESEIKGIFSVTNIGLQSIKRRYKVSCKQSVVGHSYSSLNISCSNNTIKTRKKTNLIYVGRLLEEKGICEIFELISKLDENKFNLTIIGKGVLEEKVKAFAKEHNNVNYLGYIKSKNQLFEIYEQMDVQLLLSKRTKNWEELFGMVIIEAMAKGVITISTNHTGPREVIDDRLDGFLISEDNMLVSSVREILENQLCKLSDIKENAIKKSKNYSSKEISKKWKIILKDYVEV